MYKNWHYLSLTSLILVMLMCLVNEFLISRRFNKRRVLLCINCDLVFRLCRTALCNIATQKYTHTCYRLKWCTCRQANNHWDIRHLEITHSASTLQTHCTNSSQTKILYVICASVCVFDTKQTRCYWESSEHLYRLVYIHQLSLAFVVAYVNPWDTLFCQMCVLDVFQQIHQMQFLLMRTLKKRVFFEYVRFWSTSKK